MNRDNERDKINKQFTGKPFNGQRPSANSDEPQTLASSQGGNTFTPAEYIDDEEYTDLASRAEYEEDIIRKPVANRNLKSRKKTPSRGRKKPISPGVGCLKTIIYASIVVAVSILLAGYILMGITDMLGMSKGPGVAIVVIGKDDGLNELTDKLAKEGVITQPFFFRLYATVTNAETKLEPGTYDIKKESGYDQIIAKCRKQTSNGKIVKLTFPEGRTTEEILTQLDKKKVCSKEALEKLLKDDTFRTSLIDAIKPDAKRMNHLEGYLFPDTYEFFEGESAYDVLSKFFKNTENKFTSDMRARAAELGMTTDEVIILASIIQKEAPDEVNMQKVSSVFHNRMKPGSAYPRLESNATDAYAEISANYDTYKINGLPPGAICNPGNDAIYAALNPTDTNYYFFVSDQKGKFYYAVTFEEHNKNIARADKVNSSLD